jgi:hypothetical protein
MLPVSCSHSSESRYKQCLCHLCKLLIKSILRLNGIVDVAKPALPFAGKNAFFTGKVLGARLPQYLALVVG